MRININVPDELLAQIDKKAKSLGVNRTAYMVMTLSQAIRADEVSLVLPEMQKMMKEALQKSKGNLVVGDVVITGEDDIAD